MEAIIERFKQIIEWLNSEELKEYTGYVVKREDIGDYQYLKRVLIPTGYRLMVYLGDSFYTVASEIEEFLRDIYDGIYDETEIAGMVHVEEIIKDERVTILTMLTNVAHLFVELRIYKDTTVIALVYCRNGLEMTLYSIQIQRKTAVQGAKTLAKFAKLAKKRNNK